MTRSYPGGRKSGGDDDFVQVVDKYIPDAPEIDLKGRLSPEHPRLITLVELLPVFFTELKPLEDDIQDFVCRYERRMISVDRGDKQSARDEYKDILMMGRQPPGDNDNYFDPTSVFAPIERDER